MGISTLISDRFLGNFRNRFLGEFSKQVSREFSKQVPRGFFKTGSSGIFRTGFSGIFQNRFLYIPPRLQMVIQPYFVLDPPWPCCYGLAYRPWDHGTRYLGRRGGWDVGVRDTTSIT